MGRPVYFRQRIRSQAASVEAKTLFEYLVSEVRHRRELPLEEAALVASDAYQYLQSHLLSLGTGQIELPGVAGRTRHWKQAREEQPEKLVRLSVIADDDAGVLAEFGVTTMLVARVARVIEEAYFQDALLDGPRLSLLFPLSLKALRDRLKPLWEQGALLPIAGMRREMRDKFRGYRAVLAMERYLRGEDLTTIRRELAVSRPLWQRWWQGFRHVIASDKKATEVLAAQTGYPVDLIAGWRALWQAQRESPKALERVGTLPALSAASEDISAGIRFERLLRERHHYSPAAAEQFVQELRDLAFRLNRQDRRSGQVLYFGVVSDEPPGRSLSECQLRAVLLDYLTPADWGLVDRESPQKLKWERLQRLATQAYAQGVALSLPDLAFLLGLSVDAVQSAIAEHPRVVLPTRGRVADMGPTLSHAEKIIRLFMDGYTETEIVRRTGHSYDSVERYLLDFARVVYLVEAGLPVPAIRQAVARSRRVVNKYVSLYQEFAGPDYQWRMSRIRRLAEAHPVKKN